MASDSIHQKPHRRSRWGSDSGFSIIEVLVSMALMAVIASFAVPELFTIRARALKNEALRIFDYDLSRMRSEALSSGVRAVINVASPGTSYVAGLDVLPYGATPNIDQQILSSRMPSQVKLTGATQIIFDSRGFSVDSLGQAAANTVTFSINGTNFCTATIAVTGGVTFSCRS